MRGQGAVVGKRWRFKSMARVQYGTVSKLHTRMRPISLTPHREVPEIGHLRYFHDLYARHEAGRAAGKWESGTVVSKLRGPIYGGWMLVCN